MQEEVHRSADVYMKALEAIELQKSLNMWEVSQGLSLIQRFPAEIL